MDRIREYNFLMAHFAEIDSNNVVQRVVVVSNSDTVDLSGVETESVGAAFCHNLFGGEWKQTSYNGNIRKNYAGVGYIYDADKDVYIEPKPYPTWVLDDEECQWNAPVDMPDDGNIYVWDESTTSWIKTDPK